MNIPADWKGERILLFLERPHIETTVWVNGQKTGMQNSLCVPHQYDITRYVRPGKCTITIRVDNRIKEINVGPDSHSITDQTQRKLERHCRTHLSANDSENIFR